jgi:hypothetical protein
VKAGRELVRWLRDARVPFDGKKVLAEVGETAAIPPAVARRLRMLGLAGPVNGDARPRAMPTPVLSLTPAARTARMDARPVRLRARWSSGAQQSYELPIGAAAAFAGQLRSLGVLIVWHAVERPEPTGRSRSVWAAASRPARSLPRCKFASEFAIHPAPRQLHKREQVAPYSLGQLRGMPLRPRPSTFFIPDVV